jgi:hypothetical protein
MYVRRIEGDTAAMILLPHEVRGHVSQFEAVTGRLKVPTLPDELVPLACRYPLGTMVRTVNDEVAVIIGYKEDDFLVFTFMNDVKRIPLVMITTVLEDDGSCYDCGGSRMCAGDRVEFRLAGAKQDGWVKRAFEGRVLLEYHEDGQSLGWVLPSTDVLLVDPPPFVEPARSAFAASSATRSEAENWDAPNWADGDLPAPAQIETDGWQGGEPETEVRRSRLDGASDIESITRPRWRRNRGGHCMLRSSSAREGVWKERETRGRSR